MTDWDCIVKDHGPAVWRTAYRLLGNHADAEDCFQETFAAAVTFSRQHQEPVRQWSALLIRLATARAVDRLRQRVRRSTREVPGVDHEQHPDLSPHARPPDRAEQSELSDRLRLILARLPSKQADAFCLHCLEGWSYLEVAQYLCISTDEVGVLVHRARAALKERLWSILSRETSAVALQSRPSKRPATEAQHEQ